MQIGYNETTLKRAAIYTRVSTIEQVDEGFSLDAQERALREYCERNDYEVVKHYPEKGRSGKDIKGRPEMTALLADVARRKYDVVIVCRLTRFTRSVRDLANTVELMRKYDTVLISLSESFDMSTSPGRLMLNILGVIAQYEREVISDQVYIGLTERAMQGLRTCTHVLGYNVIVGGDMEIVDEEAEVVRAIFRKYLECRSMSEVARYCALSGWYGKRGATMKEESVRRILTRPVYAGYYSWGTSVHRGNFTPIISVEQYNETQRIIDMRTTGRTRTRYKMVQLENII